MKVKQLLKTLGILVTIIILLAIGIGLTLLLKSRRGDETVSYNVAFGVLTLPIQIDSVQEGEFEISLEAEEEDTKISKKVYIVDNKDGFYPSTTLAATIAKTLTLESEYDEDQIHIYSNSENGITLNYDEDIQTITLEYAQGSTASNPAIPPDKEAGIVAKDKLEEIGLWPFSEGYITSYRYYYTQVYSYYETQVRDEASLIGVNFSTRIEEIPLISSRINSGEIEVLMNSNKQVIKISYTYRPVSEEIVATYPIKSISTALSKIASGEREVISSFGNEDPEAITITEVTFAYKIELNDQEYLQPVYVFEGTDNNDQLVTIIVPAIDDQYLINKE